MPGAFGQAGASKAPGPRRNDRAVARRCLLRNCFARLRHAQDKQLMNTAAVPMMSHRLPITPPIHGHRTPFGTCQPLLAG